MLRCLEISSGVRVIWEDSLCDEVKIVITEYQETDTGEEPYQDKTAVLPGQTISKIARITSLEGDCLVRASCVYEGIESAYIGEVIGIDETIWKYDPTDGFYYYAGILEEGESADFFKEIQIPADLPQKYEEQTLTLTVKVEAIAASYQAGNELKNPWDEADVMQIFSAQTGDVQTGVYFCGIFLIFLLLLVSILFSQIYTKKKRSSHYEKNK